MADAIRRHEAAKLSGAEVDDLADFIGALTDTHFISDPRLAFPDKACGKTL